MNSTNSIALQSDESGKNYFFLALLINFIWINASEVFRYFVFIMPMMQEELAFIPNVAPMDLTIFMIWGIWDCILIFSVTAFSWIFFDKFGGSYTSAFRVGFFIWCSIFVILWLGLFNMNIVSSPKIILTALSLSLVELVIAACITRFYYLKNEAVNI